MNHRPPLSLRTLFAVVLLAASASRADEHATYNSAGALTGLIHDGREIPIRAGWHVELEGGVGAALQPHDQKSPITRDGAALSWRGHATFPNGSAASFTAAWNETDDVVTVNTAATAGEPGASSESKHHAAPLDLASLDYVIDIPREFFVGGHVEPGDTPLTVTQPRDPTLARAETDHLTFVDAGHNWTLTVSFQQPLPVTVTDAWSAETPFAPITAGWPAESPRRYHVRVTVRRGGPWPIGQTVPLEVTYRLTGRAHAAPAHVSVNQDQPEYPFDGFGGDYCFATQSPVAKYTLENLDVAWARCEFKAGDWDRERNSPGKALVTDFELMQTLTRRRVPWILSVWRLPERYYNDANEKPPGSFGRKIAPDRWPQFVELLGSFIAYAKEKYGAEPDYFSFNEPDLGVDLGFTPETHRDTIKKLGAEFERRGFKTKLLLGDTANPRDSHRYVLATAADPSAMKYVGALSVHSWWGGTPEQFQAWADVAAWVQRPLIVAEAGVDPGAYRNLAYDSYAYGLREAAQYQDLLRHARPTALIYWEFTDDYSLVHVGSDGTVTPTGRFWLMKQFCNLSPQHSHVLATTSDQPDVLVSALARDGAFALHVLNTGSARTVTIAGLPAGKFDTVQTTEAVGFKREPLASVAAGTSAQLTLPARSLTTVILREAAMK